MEITENKDDEMNQNERARETSKTFFSFSSEAEVSEVKSRDKNYSGSYHGCSLEEEREDNENDSSSKVEGEKSKIGGEDEVGEENEEDDEFESRFDMFEDSDGASSKNDNFSSYGESLTQDEDSPDATSQKEISKLVDERK